MLSLETSIENLAYVGTKNAPRLKKLGIKTVRNLLWHFPFRYDDFSQKIAIADIGEAGETVSIIGTVTEIKNTIAWRRRMSITDATIEDETGWIHAIWFHQPYLERTLAVGSVVSLSGKVARDKKGIYLSNPSYEKISSDELTTHYSLPTTNLTHTGRLVPVYPETEGVSSKYLRFLIKKILGARIEMVDPLPAELRKKYNFPEIRKALFDIHFPEKLEDAKIAKDRFAFEDILLFQLRALLDRRQMQTLKAPQITFDKNLVGNFVKSLPFELTDDQRLATFEILKDLEKSYPMNRLLNGDVGSGKTVVALIAAVEVAMAGFQVVFMAPTEILAKQHFATITALLNDKIQISPPKATHFGGSARMPDYGLSADNFQLRIGLLTGSEAKQFPADETETEKISKKIMQKKIADGKINIVIGTHAVISAKSPSGHLGGSATDGRKAISGGQNPIAFKNLGLVVIDEQHRFGVEQRMKLLKSQPTTHYSLQTTNYVPHLLSMTATPIPRTLALTIYGDLDVSLLKEKPKGRQEIITRIIPPEKRQSAYKFIDDQIKEGRQVFVICPRIEISKAKEEDGVLNPTKPISLSKLVWSEVKAVTEEFEKLSKQIFPHRHVAMLHGKLKSKEKDEIMTGFKNKKYDLVVSTSVVEVGVDIPNASIMMIESAERFGLAQLHQFRGRVGRGEHQSYCLLFTSDGYATHRLKALEKTNNGFELAEADLKIRGPGEFTGVKQSGIPDLAMASLTDIELIKKARLEAKLLLKDDPTLKSHPALTARLLEMQRLVHFE
jgi:ATP-dependent DNA helicase RecG